MSAKGSHSNCESIFSLGLPELGATPVRSIVWRPQAKLSASGALESSKTGTPILLVLESF